MAKRTHHSLLGMMICRPFMIHEPMLRVMMAVASRSPITPGMLEQYPGPQTERANTLSLRGDVAVLPITGPIFRHATMFDRISGGTTTDMIAEDLGVALQDPRIKSIVLKINSPGGEAASIGELAGMVREADAQKPVTAYFDFWGMSAAYYIGAAAGKRVANKASFLGSIGVISAWTSDKKLKESLGLEDIVVISPQTPAKGLDPESEEGLDQLRKELAFLADHFLADVATYTGRSRKTVREEFGQGAAVDATRALEVGMIDDLGTFEQVVSRVSGGRRYRVSSPTTSSSVGSESGASSMPKTIGQWFAEKLGLNPDDPVPAHLDPHGEQSSPSPEARGGKKDEEDDPAELRRKLAESERKRLEAETRAESVSAESLRTKIETMVRSWKGNSIHPHEEKEQVAHCLRLAEVDRANGFTGDQSLLESYKKVMESPGRKLGLLDDAVVDQQPPKGGRIESPRVAPDPPEGSDPWEADRTALKETATRVSGSNGAIFSGQRK